MITADFEVNTLNAAVQTAARIAPNKGSAFDKAAGIVVEVDFGDPPATVRATDLDTTYFQKVAVLSVTGDQNKAIWRVPAALFAGALGHLPLGSTVTLTDKGDSWLYLKCGKTKAKFRVIDADGYPELDWFDKSGLKPVEGFAKRINQVSWAANPKHHGVLRGVHITGDHMIATNGSAIAVTECSVPVAAPVTAVASQVAFLARNHPEVLIAADDRLRVSLDHDTQVTSTLLAGAFPSLSALDRFTFPHEFTFSRDDLATAIERLLVVLAGERNIPIMTFNIEPDHIKLTTTVDEVGTIVDQLEVSADISHKFSLQPTVLLSAVKASDRQTLTFHHTDDPLHPFKVSDDDGYFAVLMPVAR